MGFPPKDLGDWRETARIMTMEGYPLEDIFAKFSHVSRGTIKHRWLKGYTSNKKTEDVEIKNKIREEYKNSLTGKLPISVKELSAKYNRHPGIVRKYIQHLRPKENEIYYRSRIRKYYQNELEKGNTPSISDLIEIFKHDKQTIAKSIKDLRINAPENGVYFLKKKPYLSLKALSNLTNFSAVYLRSIINKNEIRRINLSNNGKNIFFYSFESIITHLPQVEKTLLRISAFDNMNIKNQKPSNLTEEEFIVFVSIVHFQEYNVYNNRHPIKPTRNQITISLNLYKLSEHGIENCIARLKYLKYIKENDNYFLIQRGPKDLLHKRADCLHPKTRYITNQYCPRMFTSNKWAVTGLATPEEYQSSSETKLILSLMKNKLLKV